MSARNKEIVEKVNAAFAANRVEDFLSLCAGDLEWTMVGEKTVKGKDAVRTWMGSMSAAPPQFSVLDLIAEGDSAMAHGDMTMEEAGRTVPYSYCDVYKFRGDKIVSLRSYVVKTGA